MCRRNSTVLVGPDDWLLLCLRSSIGPLFGDCILGMDPHMFQWLTTVCTLGVGGHKWVAVVFRAAVPILPTGQSILRPARLFLAFQSIRRHFQTVSRDCARCNITFPKFEFHPSLLHLLSSSLAH